MVISGYDYLKIIKSSHMCDMCAIFESLLRKELEAYATNIKVRVDCSSDKIEIWFGYFLIESLPNFMVAPISYNDYCRVVNNIKLYILTNYSEVHDDKRNNIPK